MSKREQSVQPKPLLAIRIDWVVWRTPQPIQGRKANLDIFDEITDCHRTLDDVSYQDMTPKAPRPK